jgi:putative iron-dependent peroxidase
MDLCFELAQRLTTRLVGAARVVDEVHGFRSFDERDLLGFVDGTENPDGCAANDAVLIGAEDPLFAGGSDVVVQKYVHDLDGWDELPVEHQELAIGRTKLTDLEMPDDVKPANSHVALNTIVDANGDERQIVRFNMPFGNVGSREFGTYFIGYSRTPDVIEEMLRNMFIGKPPGNHDRILGFSTALTGNVFFAPPGDFLDDPPVPDQAASAVDATNEDPPVPEDGSLRVGSLRDARPQA